MTITATTEFPASAAVWASTAIFNWGVEPMFGWADCAGGLCSNGELAWRFVRGPVMVGSSVFGGEAAPVVGKAISTGAQAVGAGVSQNAPTAIAIAMMKLWPDASAGIANDLGVQGAEQLEQTIMLERAAEGLTKDP